MIPIALALTLIFPISQKDERAFRDAFAQRRTEIPSAKPDPAIVKAMDILANRLLRDTNAKTTAEDVKRILVPYVRAIGEEESLPTDYSNIYASLSRSRGRLAIGIKMGNVSRLRVFDVATSKPIALPKEMDWQYQFDSEPTFQFDGGLVVNGTGIQDAGVRYGYRVHFLKPGPEGYTLAKAIKGIWTLEDNGVVHFGSNGNGVKLYTIDYPQSFFTDNVTKLFVRETTYAVRLGVPTVEREKKDQPAFRFLDGWMARAMKSPTTALEKRFRDSYGTKSQMLIEWSVKPHGDDTKIELELDTKYVFTLKKRADSYSVVDFVHSK